MNEEIDRRTGELHQFMRERVTGRIDPDTGAPVYDMGPAEIAEARDREAELEGISARLDVTRMASVAERQALERERVKRSTPPPIIDKRLSERVLESREYRERDRSNRNQFSLEMDGIDFKSLLSIANGSYVPANPRTDIVSVFPQRRPMVADAIPQDPTMLQVVSFMRGTLATQAADSVSEGATKPEAALAFEATSVPVVKIAQWIPATEEQIDDVFGIRNLIDNQLLLGLMLKEEDKILNGPGGGSDMMGFYHQSGVQTQAQGADTMADAIYKAMSLVRWTGFAEPSAVMIKQTDFDTMRLAKNTFGDYIWGPPSLPGPDCIWGKPAIVTPAVTAGRPLTGDFVMHAHISRRLDGRVSVSDSHSDYFGRNILAIVAEMREALEIYRPSAFCFVD